MAGAGAMAKVSIDLLLRETDLRRHEAERLLLVASRLDRPSLARAGVVTESVAANFRHLGARRLAGEPLQHLEGTVQFGPLELMIDSRALIPRPETEQLWEKVVAKLAGTAPQVVVDLCTGSGNLALALKHAFPEAVVYGADISEGAIALAAENGLHTGLDVQWIVGDMFDPVPSSLRGAVDLIVSNPPYVGADEYAVLPIDVRDHEPHLALVSGPAGDETLARIAQQAAAWLAPGGLVACEIGESQAEQARTLFRAYDARVSSDLTGRDRFVVGRAPR